MIKVHGVNASPFVRKVLAALALKGLDFEQLQQMPYSVSDEYKKISPLGKIPALQDGDINLCDSTVICEYLEQAYPDNPIYPSSPADRAKARWLEELGDSRGAEFAGSIFFQRFLRPVVMKQETNEELVDKIINVSLPPILDYMESEIPSDGFLFGDFCIADIGLVSAFINASYVGYTVDSERWPRTASFIERVKAHPVIKPLVDADIALFGLDK